jgi:hypothetical protein
MKIPSLVSALAIATALLTSHSSLAAPGGFLRAPGSMLLNEAGKQMSVAVSTFDNAKQQLCLKVTWHSGDVTHSDSMESFHLTPNLWFVFVEDASRTWIFDGQSQLRVLLTTEKHYTNSEGQSELNKCPKEVREALPDSVRKKYFK